MPTKAYTKPRIIIARSHDCRILGDSFMAELLVHSKPAEIYASALDALFAVELEAVAVEEQSGRKTGEGSNTWNTNGKQRGLNALVEPAGHTATGKRGLSEKKVQVAVVGVGSEACDN